MRRASVLFPAPAGPSIATVMRLLLNYSCNHMSRVKHYDAGSNPPCMKATFLLGRILFGGFFLYNGINHFKNHNMLAQYAGAKKVPAPEAAVAMSGALLAIGGTSILLGLKPKIGAAALVAFLAGVSPSMHDFWNAADAQQRQSDMIHFMKNLALLGAALSLMGIEEPWPASLAAGQLGSASVPHRIAA